MADQVRFRDLQYRLAAHIRDPEKHAAPADIEERRLAIYRELFFNNVSGLLAGTYPVLYEILGKSVWHTLIRDYFSRHQSHTPYFLEIPRDFLKYLENDRTPNQADPPFMLELAHYEWIELALSVDEAEPDLEGVDRDGDLMEGIPMVSPLVRVLSYRYPVHRIGPDYQPTKPPGEATWLVVFRDLHDSVGFLHINQVTARLIELARDRVRTGRQILGKIATEMGHQRPERVLEGGRDILKMLHEKAIILGAGKQIQKGQHHGKAE